MNRGLPSMTALLGLVALAGYQNRDKLTELFSGHGAPGTPDNPGAGAGVSQPTGASGQPAAGGLGAWFSQLTGGSSGPPSAGGFLSKGIGELLESFKQGGHADVAQSWVGTGPNQPIAPAQLGQAVGPDVLAALEKQTGLSRDELLARLSRDLPDAVDRYTPGGHVPSSS
jgi:uncharacterized protein YidB (DUF937 family)